MRNNFSYWFTDFGVKILTFDSLVFKNLIRSADKDILQKNVLDLGCGTGTQAQLFFKSKYRGLDVDPGAVAYARLNHPGYKFEVADATNFSLRKKFDVVLMVGVLHHLSNSDLNKCLKQIRFHLKQNGKFILIEAVPPLKDWNILGKLLRAHDRGEYIRKLSGYKIPVQKYFEIIECRNVAGGAFDYAFIISHQKRFTKKA